MKVYRIKHKPSGLYYNGWNKPLDTIGKKFNEKPNIGNQLFCKVREPLSEEEFGNTIVIDQPKLIYAKDWEIEEYEIKD